MMGAPMRSVVDTAVNQANAKNKAAGTGFLPEKVDETTGAAGTARALKKRQKKRSGDPATPLSNSDQQRQDSLG